MMPSPDVYELEYQYWPWGLVVTFLRNWLVLNAPESGFIIDYMCGTGQLLNSLREERPDLLLWGCCLDDEYVAYAQKYYPSISIEKKDALQHMPLRKPEIIICAAGLHHLEYELQPIFLAKIARELAPGGTFLLAEETISHNVDMTSRSLAVIELGAAILRYATSKAAPPSVVGAAVDLLKRDLFQTGEYKTSESELANMLCSSFSITSRTHLWPFDQSDYGDRVFICKPLQS